MAAAGEGSEPWEFAEQVAADTAAAERAAAAAKQATKRLKVVTRSR